LLGMRATLPTLQLLELLAPVIKLNAILS